MRQSLRRHKQNLLKQEAYKKLIKQIRKFVADKKPKEAQKLFPSLYRALDKAAKTNVIKKNKASRLKSRITRSLRTNQKKA